MKVNEHKNKYRECLAIALALFVISPIDDVVVAALFGTALFGFGSLPFYILLGASSTVSIILWKRHKHRKEPTSQHTPPFFNYSYNEKVVSANPQMH